MRSRYSSFMDRMFKKEEKSYGEMSADERAKISSGEKKFMNFDEETKAKIAAKKEKYQ